MTENPLKLIGLVTELNAALAARDVIIARLNGDLQAADDNVTAYAKQQRELADILRQRNSALAAENIELQSILTRVNIKLTVFAHKLLEMKSTHHYGALPPRIDGDDAMDGYRYAAEELLEFLPGLK